MEVLHSVTEVPCSTFLKTKAPKALHFPVLSVAVKIIHLLGKSVSFTILIDMTMLEDEKQITLPCVLIFKILNVNRVQLPILDTLRSPVIQEKSGQKAILFYSVSSSGYLSFWLNSSNYKRQCHEICFFKGNFLCIPVGKLGKIYQPSAACIFNCSWVLPIPSFFFLMIRILHFQIFPDFTLRLTVSRLLLEVYAIKNEKGKIQPVNHDTDCC